MSVECGDASVVSGAANTKGSWAEVIASTAVDGQGIVVAIRGYSSTYRRYLIDIGVGAGGAESVVVGDIVTAAGSNVTNGWSVYIPIDIPSGTRVSARSQSSAGSSTLDLIVGVVSGTATAPTTVQSYGADTSDSGGATVDCGATPNTKGAYTEVSASITADITWIVVFLTSRGNQVSAQANFFADIATGAAGAESVIIADLSFFSNTSGYWTPSAYLFPISIASGTRLAARGSSQTADATDRLFDVGVIGVDDPGPSPGGGGAAAYAFMG